MNNIVLYEYQRRKERQEKTDKQRSWSRHFDTRSFSSRLDHGMLNNGVAIEADSERCQHHCRSGA